MPGTSIGIVGAGVAGLHLGLLLRQHDVPAVIYTDRTGEQIAGGRLPNTVGHHHHTLERERRLGVHHWDAAEYGYVCHHHYFGGPQPLRFRGDFVNPSSVIDYRLYLPRLMDDFQERGGELVVGPLQADGVDRLGERHDLVVVASGRASLGELFPRRTDKSPYDRPQRRLCVGLFFGVERSQPKGVTLSVSPGHGELIDLPMFSRDGHVTALLFENVPGGDLEVLADLPYDDDPARFHRTVLEKLEQHHPAVFERVDPTRFALTGPLDLLQGALTPTVRGDYARLSGGTYALAVGDVHTTIDPVVGQGANAASFSAWTVGQGILSDYALDERFCQRVARQREGLVLGASDWTNLMLAPPPPHLLDLVVAMAQHKPVCDEFTDNFNDPERQWDILATPERTRRFLDRHLSVAATDP